MTRDTIERFEGALIQHGPLSRRIYLMDPAGSDPLALSRGLVDMARRNGYTKIFAKVPEGSAAPFLELGFREEARVPGFYGGRETALFLALFLDPERAVAADAETIRDIERLARSQGARPSKALPPEFRLRPCTPEDIPVMSAIYREVFPSYPFPIDDPRWLLETMQTHVDYYGVEHEGSLVALASSEMDLDGLNVEMTDFATLPKWRGHGFGLHLLRVMEEGMRARGMKTAYTIARAASAGMNITFARAGYLFGGTLVNNTNISGGIESMNVWCRSLQ
ncbi:putative beta-lysine N-acetyltransferase [Chlorobium sp. N1]|uniref:putative beta-lysine N-acetyltransferase n=1 Tax=Chlorobium sp. N1 TaxID=2491138 RepID=UPI00103F8CB7|nr:putative beta-lysine N-acetyltransferase [Chlorobium sp. N1]TCD48703.1 putative beta-lysine N-acetyltransferase [Chlorobium sp. N1]